MIPIIEAETERLVGVYHGGTDRAHHRQVIRVIVESGSLRPFGPSDDPMGTTDCFELMWLEKLYREPHSWSPYFRSVWVLSTLPGQKIPHNNVRDCDMFPPGCWKTK